MDKLPTYYHQRLAMDEAGRQAQEEATLVMLRDEMTWGPRDASFAENAYKVSRQIGDSLVNYNEGEHAGEVLEFLDATRWYATPTKWQTGTFNELLGEHNRRTKAMTLDHEQLLGAVTSQRQLDIENAVTIKNPNDGRLLAYLGITSHEAGHALLSGISALVDDKVKDSQKHLLAASQAYILHNPQFGFTGNSETDTWIHEERFAEGYSRAVVGRAMEVLGYDSDEISSVMNATFITPDFSGKPGQNQIEYIEAGSLHSTPAVQIKSIQHDAPSHQKYEGELGYSLPLSVEELSDELLALSTLCREAKLDLPDRFDYTEIVEQGRDSRIEAHLQEMFKGREAYLKAKETGASKEIVRFSGRQALKAIFKRKTR